MKKSIKNLINFEPHRKMNVCENSFSRLSKGLVRLSSVLLAASAFSYSNVAFADVEGIPFNAAFPNAQHPYAQAPNGCSGPFGTSEVRDTWGRVNFTGACNTHDRCYIYAGF